MILKLFYGGRLLTLAALTILFYYRSNSINGARASDVNNFIIEEIQYEGSLWFE